jgi:prepilin-type N-terminal cleavage/methylation domain-containing protein
MLSVPRTPSPHEANGGWRRRWILKPGRRAVDARFVSRQLRDQLEEQDGFTLIEVLVAAMVLVVGLLALLGMLDVASKATQTNRVRQEATNVGREVVEDVEALSYTQLATPTSIATALLPQLKCQAGVPTCSASLSGSTITVTRSAKTGGGGSSGYAFNVTFTTCSLDDPSDGYGNHSQPPASGGSWCPDVAPSGSTDANPDDYKRVSVIVTPTGNGGAAVVYPVQQTVDIYARAVNGPAVSCLTIPAGPCPGQNQSETLAGVTSVTFDVTTTSVAQEIQWLVNGNPPGTQDPTGANGTYTPSGTTSSFTWNIPTTTVGGTTYTIDGTYSITAVALDANGNSGTRSTLAVTVNEHAVLAPTSFNAGFDQQIGGVDVQWVPSVDQDVLYYHVYHQYGNRPAALVSCATPGGSVTNVTGTSCTDTSAPAPPPATCTYQQSYTTPNVYWVVGVDRDPNGNIRESSFKSPSVDANLCDHAPSAPTNLTGSPSGGAFNLSWFVPSPVDPDSGSGDTITAWRVYRWPVSQGSTPQITVANRLQLVGAGSGSPFVTTASDTSPDPGGAQQYYCVTAVDTHLNESPCSSVTQQ